MSRHWFARQVFGDDRPATTTGGTAGDDKNPWRRAFQAARAHPGAPQKVKTSGGAASGGVTFTITSDHRGNVRVHGSDGTDTTYPPGGGPSFG